MKLIQKLQSKVDLLRHPIVSVIGLFDLTLTLKCNKITNVVPLLMSQYCQKHMFATHCFLYCTFIRIYGHEKSKHEPFKNETAL